MYFFLLSNCLNWKIYCDDHSSLQSEVEPIAIRLYAFSRALRHLMCIWFKF